MWFVLIWLAPEMVVKTSGWELTPNLQSVLQVLGVTMLALAVVFWMMPTWAGDNLKQVGMVLGMGLNLLFIAINVFHVTTGAMNFDPLGVIPPVVFTVLFFWKSRAAA